jgi:hypothetical protein
LAPIVDAVNASRARQVKVEEHSPLANAETVQSFTIHKTLYVTFTRFAISSQR